MRRTPILKCELRWPIDVQHYISLASKFSGIDVKPVDRRGNLEILRSDEIPAYSVGDFAPK
ncbi:MAG: hypothetical protein WBA62_20830 [Xanthobacteraceae bacterium]